MSTGEKITVDDLIDALEEAAVLAAFCRLPKPDQANFSRWIGMARDDASHWRRIETFVQAMKESPLQPKQSLSERFDQTVFR